MGVKGGEVRVEEKRPFLSLLLYCLSRSTQQNKTGLSQQLSAGPRSPGDRLQQTGLFFTSQLSASGLSLAVPGPRAVNKPTKTTKH